VAGVPDHVLTARLAGGELNGLLVEVEAGQETLKMGPMLAAFGGPPDELERFRQRVWEYRFAGVEDVDHPEETHEAVRRAVFDFVGLTEDATAEPAG